MLFFGTFPALLCRHSALPTDPWLSLPCLVAHGNFSHSTGQDEMHEALRPCCMRLLPRRPTTKASHSRLQLSVPAKDTFRLLYVLLVYAHVRTIRRILVKLLLMFPYRVRACTSAVTFELAYLPSCDRPSTSRQPLATMKFLRRTEVES